MQPFGGGHDTYVDSNLSSGYSYACSYGGNNAGRSIIDGSYCNGQDIQIRALEVLARS